MGSNQRRDHVKFAVLVVPNKQRARLRTQKVSLPRGLMGQGFNGIVLPFKDRAPRATKKIEIDRYITDVQCLPWNKEGSDHVREFRFVLKIL